MWLDLSNNKYTTQEVAEILEQMSNRAYTVKIIEDSYSIGDVCRDHGCWFQRIG